MNIYSAADSQKLPHQFFSRTFYIKVLSKVTYINRFWNFCLFLIFSFVSFSPTIIARDLAGKESNVSNSLPQTKFVPDSVPSHLINWPLYFGVQQTGELDASFDCFGNFGTAFGSGPYDFIYAPHFPSFVTPPATGIEHLFGGAIWIGGIVGDDTLVSIGADGWQAINEFFPPDYGKSGSITPVEDYPADFSMRAEFTDTLDGRGNYVGFFDPYGHRPLNIKVSNRSHAWHSSPENGTIIYDMVITNIGDKTIKEGYAGLYFDCDVGNDQPSYFDDFAGSLREQGIGYAIDNDGDFNLLTISPATKIFASKFLETSFKPGDTNFNWWIPNGNAAFDYGPRQRGTRKYPFRDFGTGGTGTPEGDANKYYMMSFKEWDYDLFYSTTIGDSSEIWQPQEFPTADLSGSFDIRYLISIGPFSLQPDSSVRILFATFTGDSVHNLSENFQDNLPHDPDLYLSNLNFDDVLANSAISDSLGQLLLDPYLPPIGFQIVKKNRQQPELQWDPWVYKEVTGYKILIEEADLSQLPQPGAIPPWWSPPIDASAVVTRRTHRYSLSDLDPNSYYPTSIQHKIKRKTGQKSEPLQFRLNPRESAPQSFSNIVTVRKCQTFAFGWTNTGPDIVDHFNIYKFDDSKSARAIHPRYDQGYLTQFRQPRDSFNIDDKTYYYYAMEAFATISGHQLYFYDTTFQSGNAYIITSSDQYGMESEFSEAIIGYMLGDVNADGDIDLHDLSLLIDVLFRGLNLPIIKEAADLNGDGLMSILDIEEIVAILYLGAC